MGLAGFREGSPELLAQSVALAGYERGFRTLLA